MNEPRYFLDQDQSCHWYLVPLENSQEWEDWLEIDEDDEKSWEVPGFARRLDGDPARVTFSDPVGGGL